MVTGDYINTAIAVAKDLGMADSTKPVLLIEAKRAQQHTQFGGVSKTALSPCPLPLNSMFQSALYTTTAAAQQNSAHSMQAAMKTLPANDHGGEGLSLEESAAIQHAPSLELDPALYCTRRHVDFAAMQPEQLLSQHDAHQPSGLAPQRSTLISCLSSSLHKGSPYQTPFSSHSHQPLLATDNHLNSTKSTPPACRPCLAPSPNPPDPPSAPLRLMFLNASTGLEMVQAQAVLALAEGRMQCAVTGDSFEQLLQQSDVSVVELVMRNAVVFARMKPHQKGQVMDLLGRRGLYQIFQGRPRHIQVCIAITAMYWPLSRHA